MPEALLYRCAAGDEKEAQLLCEKLLSLLDDDKWPSVPDVSDYELKNLIGRYRQIIVDTIEAGCS